jgi:hypothetical protein
MAELEHRLRALGLEVDWPATPELRVPRPEPARRSWRPAAVVALAVLAVAIAAAMAVPQARTSILRFFHLRGVTVYQVEKLPEVQPIQELRLGAPVSLAEARLRLGQPILLPEGRRPDATYFDGALASGGVNLRYGPLARPRLLVSEFLTANMGVIQKYVKFARGIEPVSVNGGRGFWIPEKHVVEFGPLPPRLATSTLLWEAGPVTMRLEGDLTKPEALKLARTFRR